MHQARWMARVIYNLKVWRFRSQFKMIERESQELRDLNIFLAKIYVKFWFLTTQATTSARNDLQLLKELHAYPQREISEVISH